MWSLQCPEAELLPQSVPPRGHQGLQPPPRLGRAVPLHPGQLRAGCPVSPWCAGSTPSPHPFSGAAEPGRGGEADAAALSPVGEDLAGDPG